MLLEEEKMIKIAKQKLGLSITNDFSDGADVYCYQESTADGYEVWVLTHDHRDVNVNENVYYYDHDIADELFDMITSCSPECTLNIDEDTWNDLYMDDQMLEYFGDSIDDIIEDNDEEGYGLTQAEIQDLTKEYGLDAEEIDETVS
tara:strand:- start:20 stop:457 length:438 start_codon:yes stop_codon:yes gene_type:complete